MGNGHYLPSMDKTTFAQINSLKFGGHILSLSYLIYL